MKAKVELVSLRARIQEQINRLQSEMNIVDGAIKLLDRENGPLNPAGKPATTPLVSKRFKKVGLSDAIRDVINGEYVSPTEVRDELIKGGYRNNDKSKLLASVYATLKRLKDSNLESAKIDGKLKYRRREDPQTKPTNPNVQGPGRKAVMYEWLKNNGPATRKEIWDGTGLPEGTISSYLSSEKHMFEKRDDKWIAL